MKLGSFVFTLAFIFASGTASASLSAARCRFETTVQIEGSISTSLLDRFSKLYAEALAITPGFKHPENIRLEIQSGSLGGTVRNSKEGSVFLTVDEKLPVESGAIFIHEYGHLIFDRAMALALPEVDAAARLEIPTRSMRFSDPRYVSARSGAYPFRVMSPYSELFADVLAVLALEDPRVMARATDEVRRDFTLEHRMQFWKEEDRERHLIFSPVRSFIWNRFLLKDLDPQQKILLVEGLLQAIAEEVGWILARSTDRMAANGFEAGIVTYEEANQRLIARIKGL